MFEKINDPIIIKNSNFRGCIFALVFPIYDYREEDLAVLKHLVFDKSLNYDTDEKIYKVNINNYCLSYTGGVVFLGNSPFLEFHLSFPSFNSVKKDVLEDNLYFAKEIIYNSYLIDGFFPSDMVKDTIRLIKNNINRKFKDGKWYYMHRNDTLIDEDNYLVNPILDNINLLDGVDEKTLYRLYKKIISGPPLTFLIGNVNEEECKKLIKKIILDNKIEKVVFEKKYNHFVKDVSSDLKMVREVTNFKTSFVCHTYKVRDMKCDRDKVLLLIVKKLLYSNDSFLLFDVLRKENNLVYRCGVSSTLSFGNLSLWAMTGKDNINSVSNCYDVIMSKISDINFITSKFSLILNSMKEKEDLIRENIMDYLVVRIKRFAEFNEKSRYEMMKDITALEVKNFIDNRLVLVSKYVGVGEEDE